MNVRHPVRRAIFGVPFLAAALLVVPALLHAQEIEGLVVQEGWGEPVAGATVTLLNESMLPVDSATADPQGRFAFSGLDPGTYYVQAAAGGHFSSLSDGIAVAAGAPGDPVVLTFTSPLFRLALACFDGEVDGGTGVLAGFAYESRSEVPLPGARIRVEWPRDDSETRGSLVAVADEGGRFAVCGVPSGVPLSAWIQALGQVGQGQHGIRVDALALARYDMPLDLGVAEPSADVYRVTAADEEVDQLVLTGRILDASNRQPVIGAVVTVPGVDGESVTDHRGTFRLTAVPIGVRTIQVRHLGYGEQEQTVDLPLATEVAIELRLAARALELEGLTVRARPAMERARRAAAYTMRSRHGADLRFAEMRGERITDVVHAIPGVRVAEGRFHTHEGPTTICVEGSRSSGAIRAATPPSGPVATAAPFVRDSIAPDQTHELPGLWCDMVEVIIDGVAVPDPGLFLRVGVSDYESIEYLPPLAATRWGFRASQFGALVLWTRGRGPHVDPRRNAPEDG